LEKDVRKLLYRVNVGDKFEKERLGDDVFHVTFPFVKHEGEQPVKVIKPLHLAHPEPTKIYEHGAAWIYRINKLKGRFIEPEQVLFTLAGPDQDKNRLAAYHDIEHELQAIGVKTLACDDRDAITRFALH